MMRRTLVLTDMPPHVRRQHTDAPLPDKQGRVGPAVTAADVREFLMAYCSCLVAATAFLF
ncbi:hypothetical protein GRI75_06370 [Altererythrobacter soli]|uniref:Uncharacterized protein n=1 Tax=Croceibacterium soli TaxID=1739690 RepID=A0A6I4US40_9SPHN|nr:hypothetical protein [Croceibacterium soli]MXP41266.1 hypothetical protein [Croceibacterium soli]